MPTLNLVVNNNNDDAMERSNQSGFSSTGTSNQLGIYSSTNSSTRSIVGTRFTNVTIPKGATIDSAIWSCWVSNNTQDNIKCVICGENVDNSVDYATSAIVWNRARTTANVAWAQDNLQGGTNKYTSSPDIKTIIQEIINRSGWTSGNAINILFVGDDDVAKNFLFHAHENTSGNAAKLDITYTVSGTDYEQSISGSISVLSGVPSKSISRSISGSAGSILGGLTRSISKALSGASGALSGVISRLTNKNLAGTSGSLTGALSSSFIYIRELAGTVGTMSGSISKAVGKALSGSISNTGNVVKSIGRSLTGTSGSLSGSIDSQVIELILKALGGSISAAGSISKQIDRTIAGTVSILGSISKTTGKSLAGASGALAGVLGFVRYVILTGNVGSISGSISRYVTRTLLGSFTQTGFVNKGIARTITGSLSNLSGIQTIDQVYRRAKLKASRVIKTAIKASSTIKNSISGGRRGD